jgi:hypothetical protein
MTHPNNRQDLVTPAGQIIESMQELHAGRVREKSDNSGLRELRAQPESGFSQIQSGY